MYGHRDSIWVSVQRKGWAGHVLNTVDVYLLDPTFHVMSGPFHKSNAYPFRAEQSGSEAGDHLVTGCRLDHDPRWEQLGWYVLDWSMSQAQDMAPLDVGVTSSSYSFQGTWGWDQLPRMPTGPC
jgi:hypothetical protein